MLTIKILDVSDQPLNWDAADALAAGWTTEQALQWAKEHAKILTSHDIEKARLEEEKRLMEEKKTPQENTPDSAPQLTVAAEQKPTVVQVAEPQGNVIPIRDIQTKEWLPETFSHFALATAWGSNGGEDWRYTHKWGKWFHWDGSKWAEDETNHVTYSCKRQLIEASNWQEAQILSAGQRRSLCSLKTMKEVVAVAGFDPRHAVPVAMWDANKYMLGTPAGVVDLNTGNILAASKEQHITKNTAVAPAMDTTEEDCQHWIKTLQRATGGGDDMLDYLQRWCYYILTGETKHECFAIVWGPGGSGKSTFVRVLSEIMCDYARSTGMETFTETKNQDHATEIANLAGARLVTATEPGEGSRWNESRIKHLTGRDKVSARYMRQDFFEFEFQGKILIASNFKPQLRSVGEEMRRRIHLIAFPHSIPENERIPDMPDLLRAEYPAILAWMIRGGDSWRLNGMKRPEAIMQSVEEYLQAEDTLGSWLDECCVIGDDNRIQSSEAYKSYAAYVDSHGEGIISQKRFVQRLEDRGFGKSRSGGVRYVTGLQLSKEPQQSYMDKYDDKW